MNISKRKLRIAIPAGIVALALSMGSVAFACGRYGGQAELWTRNGLPADSTTTFGPGDLVGLRGEGVATYNAQGQPIQHWMYQDATLKHCGPGSVPMTLTTWTGPPGTTTFDIDSTYLTDQTDGGASTAVEGKLAPALKGQVHLCFGDTVYTTWPVIISIL